MPIHQGAGVARNLALAVVGADGLAHFAELCGGEPAVSVERYRKVELPVALGATHHFDGDVVTTARCRSDVGTITNVDRLVELVNRLIAVHVKLRLCPKIFLTTTLTDVKVVLCILQNTIFVNLTNKKAPVLRRVLLMRNSLAGRTGLEPATSAVTGQCSNQLNYRPRFLQMIL